MPGWIPRDTCQPVIQVICPSGTKCRPPQVDDWTRVLARLNLGLTSTAMYRPSAFSHGQAQGHRTESSYFMYSILALITDPMKVDLVGTNQPEDQPMPCYAEMSYAAGIRLGLVNEKKNAKPVGLCSGTALMT